MIVDIQYPAVFRPILESRARYKGAFGGRGSGKSHFFAGLIVDQALDSHIRAVGIREYQASIKESSKQLIDDKIRDYGVAHLFKSTDHEIRGPNDSLIVFRGLQAGDTRGGTAASLKSMEGFNRAWIDEAQQISAKSWRLLKPTFRAPGAEIWASWNPGLPTDPIDAFFRHSDAATDDEIVCVRANWSDNEFFPDGLQADMERDRRRDPDDYAHTWMGEYERKGEARVFKNWRIGKLDIPKGSRPYFGADWGFARDPTVLIRCWVWDRTLYIDREIHSVGCEIDRTPVLFDKMNDARISNVREWPIIADSSWPQTIAYMVRHGYPKIEPARKGPDSINEGIEFLKNYDIVIHPDCRHTSDEFTLYAYKVDKKTEEILPELDDDHNHVIDAVRYAVEKLRRSPPLKFVVPFAASQARGFPG